MKIGINGRFLVAKQTGVQRAAYNLVSTLMKVDRENEYFLFTGYEEVHNPSWKYTNVTIVPSPLQGGQAFKNLFWEQVTLPRLAKRYQIDILHSPANMAPLFYRGHSIIHIHDLCFVVNPQWYSFSFRTWYNLVIPRLAKRATRVVTNSNNSKNDLLQFCSLGADKVRLVHWAVDESFLEYSLEPSEELKKEDYILYVGSLEPRKNIKTLIEAFKKMRRDNPSLKTKLLLIGGENPLFADVGLTSKNFRDDVILKGFVDEKSLKHYYRKASLVAYPSLYEGFGLPPLEAMASGTPVVTSLTSSIPEVVGNAAIMVNPHDVNQLSSSMAQVLLNKDLQNHLISKGYEQVKTFNWYKVARHILAIYYEVHHGRSTPMSHWQKLRELEVKFTTARPSKPYKN